MPCRTLPTSLLNAVGFLAHDSFIMNNLLLVLISMKNIGSENSACWIKSSKPLCFVCVTEREEVNKPGRPLRNSDMMGRVLQNKTLLSSVCSAKRCRYDNTAWVNLNFTANLRSNRIQVLPTPAQRYGYFETPSTCLNQLVLDRIANVESDPLKWNLEAIYLTWAATASYVL